MNGRSGKVAGKDNFKAFENFIAACDKEKLWSQYIVRGGRELNKSAISVECGFARSVFVQNPAVKQRCERLMGELVSQGILKGDLDFIFPSSTGRTQEECLVEVRGCIAGLEENLSVYVRSIKAIDEKIIQFEAEAKILIKSCFKKRMHSDDQK